METAEEFVDVLSDGLYLQEDGPYLGEDAGLLIRERDNAIREAAKLELLDEIIALDDGSDFTMTAYRAVGELRAKYTQPVEPGQESK